MVLLAVQEEGKDFHFWEENSAVLCGSGGCDVTDIGNGGGQSVESM